MDILAHPLHRTGVPCFCDGCREWRLLANSWGTQWHRCVYLLRPTWTHPRYQVLYHGTTVANARLILEHGVSLPQERNTLSPGQFSYHDRPEKAAEYAQTRTGEPQVIVLGSSILMTQAARGFCIISYRDLRAPEFSMINSGRDATSIFPPEVFMQLQLVAPWGYSQRPKNIHELRAAAAAMISGVDMITGPMMRGANGMR
ncbi:hypothetical protein DFH08DRAFT_990101 [Mycena albidolilacea]|uniref:Uncharacterized protein n=1 Tax=Mycena albidolilacea TaxID=1033008 RepID=A0AAD7EWK3_9AGAR|nr:hypothetical protein DFH08DRAFT_990101 [Mycena albidolilacea]